MIQPVLTFEDFKILPVSDDPTVTDWVLWCRRGGAYTLSVSGRPRRVRVTNPATGPDCLGYIGDPIVFTTALEATLEADLPDHAPAGGLDLAEAAIFALKLKYQASPLRLREGRDGRTFAQLMTDAAMLIRREHGAIADIECDWNPDLPIRRTKKLAFDATVMIDEIGEWYGAQAMAGWHADQTRDWDGAAGPAKLILDATFPQSGHEIVAAIARIRAFYDEARTALGLDDADIELRMSFLQT